MTNVSSCYRHNTSEQIAYEYRSLVKVYLDNADRDLRESNLTTDCQESTPNPQKQIKLLPIVCKMKRWQVSFTDTLEDVVLKTGHCQCLPKPRATKRPRPLSKHRTQRIPCKVKSLLTSMRNFYESVYTESAQVTLR